MNETSIAWTDWTWNPIRGCSRISPGCQHCYAEAIAARFSRHIRDCDGISTYKIEPFHGYAKFRIIGDRREPHWTGKVDLIESKLLEPLSWRKRARTFTLKHGRKPRAFISMSDLFHENLPDDAIDRVFAMMAMTPEINYMVLTKRAERMEKYFDNEFVGARIDCDAVAIIDDLVDPNERRSDDLRAVCQDWDWDEPFFNVALGVSVESQKYADERIPHLLATPAAMRFVSQEPQLEEIVYPIDVLKMLDMVIPGGESGLGARPFDIAWARKTVEQSREAGTACFVKQMGARPIVHSCRDSTCTHPGCGYESVNLRDCKGEDLSEWPADLRVRQWPEGWN